MNTLRPAAKLLVLVLKNYVDLLARFRVNMKPISFTIHKRSKKSGLSRRKKRTKYIRKNLEIFFH